MLNGFSEDSLPPFFQGCNFFGRINSPHFLDPVIQVRSSLNWHDGGGVPAAIQLVPQLTQLSLGSKKLGVSFGSSQNQK